MGTTGEPKSNLLHPRPWLAQHEATRPKAQRTDSSNEATRSCNNASPATKGCTVSGPLIRWISRKEEVKVVVPPPPPPPPSVVPQAPVPSIYRSIYGPPGSLFTPTTYSYSSGTAVVTTVASTSTPETQFKITTPATAAQKTPYSAFQHHLDSASSPFPTWPPAATGQQQSYYPNISQPTVQPQTPATSSIQPAANATTSAPPEPQYRSETVAKNYVVHELAQQKGTPKPTWTQSMQSMFGDHVKWDGIKVFVGKNRPLCIYNTFLFLRFITLI